ncbi:MAG: hypothetical protein KTR31_20115 [Myxococcales bacterium]|nr:hypothetical protein [Myxococcales bacterium]
MIVAAIGLVGGAAWGTELSFDDAKMYEVAFFTVAAGEQEALSKKYFAKVMPIAREYGMRPMGTFAVSHQEHGQPSAATWGFFEWPSLAAKERFEQDKRFQKLKPQRDARLDALQLVYLQVAEDLTVELRDDRLYEVFGGWVNAHHGAHLQDYFAAAGPYLASRDVRFHGDFQVIGSSDPTFRPDVFGFMEWPDRSVKQGWFDSAAFRQSGWHRAMAVDRLFVLEGTANLPGS